MLITCIASGIYSVGPCFPEHVARARDPSQNSEQVPVSKPRNALFDLGLGIEGCLSHSIWMPRLGLPALSITPSNSDHAEILGPQPLHRSATLERETEVHRTDKEQTIR